MWPWIKRWHDWAMPDLWPLHRTGPQPQALYHSYEKAGLTVHDQPIPWNAEVVVVEVALRLQPGSSRRKTDFQLRLPGREAQPAEVLRRQENDDLHRLLFRIAPPTVTVNAELLWRDRVLGQLTLPVLSREEFVDNLRLHLPTLFVRLGDQCVAAQTFVSTQCKDLMASAVLTSPTSLVPLLDLDLQVELRCERGGPACHHPAKLCSSQLAGKQALLTVMPRRFPKRIGSWVVTWKLGDQVLASQRVRAISRRHFQRSLRVVDTRFVIQSDKQEVSVSRQLPPLEQVVRVGPCFLVCSRESGMAGLCRLRVRTQVHGAVQPPLLMDEEILITDGPTMVAPGTVEAAELTQVKAFEICLGAGLRSGDSAAALGILPLCPAPVAAFTSEGGFKAPEEYPWSAAAEEQLNEQLARLLENRGKSG